MDVWYSLLTTSTYEPPAPLPQLDLLTDHPSFSVLERWGCSLKAWLHVRGTEDVTDVWQWGVMGCLKLRDNSTRPFLIATVALFLFRSPSSADSWQSEASSQGSGMWAVPWVRHLSFACGRLWLKGVERNFLGCKGSSWRPCSLLTPKCLKD